jgi:hypothetical protein
MKWVHVDDGWLVLASHEHPGGWAHPDYGVYVYDPATVHPRDVDDQPPA